MEAASAASVTATGVEVTRSDDRSHIRAVAGRGGAVGLVRGLVVLVCRIAQRYVIDDVDRRGARAEHAPRAVSPTHKEST
jgi:hypothetical protein